MILSGFSPVCLTFLQQGVAMVMNLLSAVAALYILCITADLVALERFNIKQHINDNNTVSSSIVSVSKVSNLHTREHNSMKRHNCLTWQKVFLIRLQLQRAFAIANNRQKTVSFRKPTWWYLPAWCCCPWWRFFSHSTWLRHFTIVFQSGIR